MSEEPKWFSGYVKTHDQDHGQLENQIEKLEHTNKSAKDFCGEQIKINDISREYIKSNQTDIEKIEAMLRSLWKDFVNYSENKITMDEFKSATEIRLKQLTDGEPEAHSKESGPKSEGEFYKTDRGLNGLPDVPTDLKEEQEAFPCKDCDYNEEEDCTEGCMKLKYEEDQEDKQNPKTWKEHLEHARENHDVMKTDWGDKEQEAPRKGEAEPTTVYYVIEICEFYNGICVRATHDDKRYGCNELWCEKKIDKEYEARKE